LTAYFYVIYDVGIEFESRAGIGLFILLVVDIYEKQQ